MEENVAKYSVWKQVTGETVSSTKELNIINLFIVEAINSRNQSLFNDLQGVFLH